jgi:hypothetical protein
MRFVLACDQKWRDLPALVAIRCHLTRLGHACWIVSARELKRLLPALQPDIVVLNNFWDTAYHDMAHWLRAAGIAVGVLPTEGAADLDVWGSIVLGEFSDFSLLDFHLCWNKATAQAIVDHGSMPAEKIDVIGCPRFDFAVPPLASTCMQRTEFCRLLGLDPARPIVTWASRYAQARMAYASAASRAAFAADCEKVGITHCVIRGGHDIDEMVGVLKMSLDKFIDAFVVAARARSDLQFVFKPHPNDDVLYIRNRIAEGAVPNATMALGVYIGDALRSSDVLVNNDCSTSIESWIHGVPVVDAQLNRDPITGRPELAACNPIASDANEVIVMIDRSIRDRTVSPSLQSSREAFISKWFEVVDGKRSQAAAAALDRYARSHGRRRKFYSLRHGGGAKDVAKHLAYWLVGVPGGAGLRSGLLGNKKRQQSSIIFDKVITRNDVRRLHAKIRPIAIGGGAWPS